MSSFKYEDLKYLTIHFDGYYAYRIATDPDPTDEPRGFSGYTMALAGEDKLDQIVRLQVDDEFIKKNLRPPGHIIGMNNMLKKGVEVNKVVYEDKNYESDLIKAKVNFLGKDGAKGPSFQSRNNLVGSDDELSFVIYPFILEIKKEQCKEDKKAEDINIRAEDILDPTAPNDADKQMIWKIKDPSIYGRRLTQGFSVNDMEVSKAINVYDHFGHFRDRRKYINDEIRRLEKLLPNLEEKKKKEKDKKRKKEIEVQIYQTKLEIQKFKSRVHQLEAWVDRVANAIGIKATWEFEINGPKTYCPIKLTNKNGELKTLYPLKDWDWPITFWFGGWDGDLMLGFMRGELKIPVREG